MDDAGWHVGDLALCVMSEDWDWEPGPGPARGSVNRVRSVTPLQVGYSCRTGLKFDEWPDHHSFFASAFRRIAPHAPDAEDAETIRLLTGEQVTA